MTVPRHKRDRAQKGGEVAQSGWRIQRRAEPANLYAFRLGAALIGLALVVLLGAFVVDATPAAYFDALWAGTFGGDVGLESILVTMLPYVLLGLAVALPLRLGLWNVGGDGQLLMGAWAATACAFLFSTWPGWALIPIALLAAGIMGAVWILGPAVARAKLGISEIVTTLLLNFVASIWLTYWAVQVWSQPLAAGGIQSKEVPESALLGFVDVAGIAVPVGLVGAIALALLVWAWRRASRFGYELDMVGAYQSRAARYAGIPANRRLIQIMVVGGVIAGLAGGVQLLNVTHAYATGLTNSYGFIAFIIAVLAAGRELGVAVLALLFAGIATGINSLIVFGVASDLLFAVFGLVLMISALGDGLARFQVIRLRPPAEPIPVTEGAVATGATKRAPS